MSVDLDQPDSLSVTYKGTNTYQNCSQGSGGINVIVYVDMSWNWLLPAQRQGSLSAPIQKKYPMFRDTYFLTGIYTNHVPDAGLVKVVDFAGENEENDILKCEVICLWSHR